jgi:cellulose synthase/poly-beta-1,6-N-acetylglucosamine synthase-like glycosyltransferase
VRTYTFCNPPFFFPTHPDPFPALGATVYLPGVFFDERFPSLYAARQIVYADFAWLVLLPVRIKVIRSEMLLGFFLAAPPRADEIFFSWISFMNKDSIPFVMKHTPLLKVLVCDCFCV